MPRFSNDIMQMLLFYCYSYLSDGLGDFQGFQQGLEKDAIPFLVNFKEEDEVANFYQAALLYKNVVENGRPLYGLRVLNQQIEDTKALNEMN